jgi:hypothetical protein
VRRHAEHLVNILEGAEGVLFGDNDRDGQMQNPGDGIGVRGHLVSAQTQVETVLAALEQSGASSEVQGSVQPLATAIEDSRTLVQQATERIFQVFAADTVGQVQPIAADVETTLDELLDTIAGSFTISTQLLGR